MVPVDIQFVNRQLLIESALHSLEIPECPKVFQKSITCNTKTVLILENLPLIKVQKGTQHLFFGHSFHLVSLVRVYSMKSIPTTIIHMLGFTRR